MSAASADSSHLNANDSAHPPDSLPEPIFADPLTIRVERLIQTCRTLERRRQDYQAVAERLMEENSQLRRVLAQTQQQIQELVEQIRQLEE